MDTKTQYAIDNALVAYNTAVANEDLDAQESLARSIVLLGGEVPGSDVGLSLRIHEALAKTLDEYNQLLNLKDPESKYLAGSVQTLCSCLLTLTETERRQQEIRIANE